MGFRIRAAVAVSVGAAVMGLAKLRQASLGAKDAVDQVNDAAAKSNKVATFSERLRAAAAKPFRQAIGMGGRSKSAARHVGEFLGGQTTDERVATGRLMQEASQGFQSPLGGRAPRSDEEAKHERKMLELHLKKKRLIMQQVGALRKQSEGRRKNVNTALKGLNAVSMASKEARGWYKILFGGMNKKKMPRGLKAIGSGVQKITATVKKAKREFGNLTSVIGGMLGAAGGAKMLGGAKGLFTRSMDLSRAKEDARVTFDTLLGSAEQSEILMDRITKFSAQTPFQRADITEGSRQLLTITGKNVDQNEKLFKLAANMAALKPGTKVADVSKALVSASVGNFESLKSLGIVLRADQFKDAGEKGGKEYSAAVMAAITEKFEEKTGGRDLVLALSGSLSGLMSTFRDNIDLMMEGVGTAISEKLGFKQLLADVIPALNQLGRLIKFTLTGKGEFDFVSEDVPPAFIIIASTIEDLVMQLQWVKETAVSTFKNMLNWFNELPKELQKAIVGGAGMVLSFMAVATTVMPMLVGLFSLIEGLAAPIEAAGAAIMGMLNPIGAAIGLAFAAVLGAFMIFRREGEDVVDTLRRAWAIVKFGLIGTWNTLKVVIETMVPILKEALLPAWKTLETAFADLRVALGPLVDALFASETTMEDVAFMAEWAANVLGFLVAAFIKVVAAGIDVVTWLVERFSPSILRVISDVKVVTRAFLDFATGVTTGKSFIKTALMGFADVITYPFREAIATLFDMLSDSQRKVAAFVRPFNDDVAGMIESAASVSEKAGQAFREGFLATREDLLTGGLDSFMQIESQAVVQVNTTVELDGEKIGENQAETQMRSRNSGRGGDPLTPEETGFVVNSGRIRVVNPTDVLSGLGME